MKFGAMLLSNPEFTEALISGVVSLVQAGLSEADIIGNLRKMAQQGRDPTNQDFADIISQANANDAAIMAAAGIAMGDPIDLTKVKPQ